MRRRPRPLALTLLGVSFAVGGPVTGLILAGWVHRRGSRRVLPTLDGLRADTALVLGAPLRPDGTVSAMLDDRLRLGLRAFQTGAVDRVLVSGLPRESRAMERWLLMRGVPPSCLLVDEHSPRTVDSVRSAARRGVGEVILCSQRFHLPRAVVLADHYGLSAVGVSADRGPYRRQARNEVREILARARAVVDMVGFSG